MGSYQSLVCSSTYGFLNHQNCNCSILMGVQDHDGSHIKGLLINFIHSFWPSLLKVPTFMVEFTTPIIRVSMVNVVF